MKTLNVTDLSCHLSRVIDEVERDQEEVVLVRRHRQVARLVPEPAEQTAQEVLGDLYRTIDDRTAEALSEAIAESRKGKNATLASLRNPWAF